ncbi:LOW QUALITY PROTEIN: sensor histidine kinase response regulator, GAF domain-containing [Citrifermentans bemidjiense Bem]|uniref:histidine kinase n=1 Tax=Citrifermentans bemidjiense (strain ATCC BAA-1014 / DSM 16622 / JCM 12645 / Bem) TaxID=404380 RepID=B5EBM9_CITBB|nr:LOW QUALITY PROTEIN: sensor histidine kinase response regulator, GAF domain-containing [Citrifermentans bemidjiense Bem]
MTQKQLYNSRILLTYLNLLNSRYGEVDHADILDYAGISPYQVTDAAHWFTQSQVDRFNERLVQLTGNPGIAREGGRYAASRDSLGFIGKYVLGLIGPGNAFFTINQSSSNFTRSSRFACRKLATNKVEITVTPLPGVKERPFQCENRIGFFEAILASFNCESPLIDHSECTFKGGACCRYVISWRNSLPRRLRTTRNLFTAGMVALALVFHHPFPWTALSLGPLFLAFFCALSHLASHLEKREPHAALVNLKESTDELLEQTATNYQNALMVNEVGQAVSKQTNKDQLLDNIVAALEMRLGYDRGMILLADANRATLKFRVGFGYDESQLKTLQDACFSLDNPDSQGVFATCFTQHKPYLINDFSRVASLHSPQSVLFAQHMGAQSFICCPIVCEGESLGVLAMDNVRTKRPLVGSDMSLLMGVAPVIGISIRNAIYIDNERSMTEQLRQSQKREAIGELASGVAHDFNNLLTAIIGFASLAQANLDPGTIPFQYLDEVLNASERATYLTRGLLAFGRNQAANPQPVDLNRIVGQMEKLLGRLISRQIELKVSLCHESPTVLADAGQLDQVVMNLATNARDAMNNAGVLTIETAVVTFPPDSDRAHGVKRGGRYARLSVRDTGRGMDEATRGRLFEPFFTTKETGQGTGLGLAIVQGIVQQNGGFIEVESTPGEGACFLIHLPLLQEISAPAQAPLAAPLPCAGCETILVAEDALEVRRVTTELLQQHGYRVIEAADGREALEKFLAHQDQIKLVIMDLVMPRMNGRDAFDAIAKCNPDLKVLFTSAYPPEEVDAGRAVLPEGSFLAKPCQPRPLLLAVRRLLGTGRGMRQEMLTRG